MPSYLEFAGLLTALGLFLTCFDSPKRLILLMIALILAGIAACAALHLAFEPVDKPVWPWTLLALSAISSVFAGACWLAESRNKDHVEEVRR